jgi:hypothetical protein
MPVPPLHDPLRHQLVAIEPCDDLPFLHRLALVDGALDEPPGGFEGDVDLGELDIAGDHDAVFRCFVGTAIGVNAGSGGGH